MFGKPFRVKSNTAIKGSDRKKLRAQIEKLYPGMTPDQLKELVPNKEEMTVMKIYTHSGANVLVYCLGKTPIFFDVDGTVYPTVYTLWKNTELLPVMTTWPQVFNKISVGADLMLPGVIIKGEISPANLGDYHKGQPCGVKLMGNKCPVAVGKTALSSNDMYESAMRGKGVIILHYYQDHLWAHGEKSDPPMIEDSEMLEYLSSKRAGPLDEVDEEESDGDIEGSPEESPSSAHVENQIAKMTLEDQNSEFNETTKGAVGGKDPSDLNNDNEEQSADDSIDLQAKMDDLLYQCFIHAIKTTVKPKSDLPMLTSKFFKAHVQACCPPGENLDVKKSSYKKLSKFLGAMSKQGFIKVKELSKGCESVMEIHKDHPEVKAFAVPDLPAAAEEQTSSSADAHTTVQIVDMYLVSTVTAPLFKNAGLGKGKALVTPEIRQVIKEYVAENELQIQYKPSHVTLDPVLSDITLNRDEYSETITWENLVTRVCAKMNQAYQITLPGQKPVVKKGKPESVVINVIQRGGNKKVTLVHNLETYGVDLQALAHDVQIGMACSTSINPLPGKNKGMEVLVQGNQINFIANLLSEKYGINKKFMQGLEKAPKSGKKKR